MVKLNRADGELLITYINYQDPTLLLAGVTGVKNHALWMEMAGDACMCM